MEIEPSLAGSSSLRMRSRVDFPDPLEPTMPYRSPLAKRTVAPSNRVWSPKLLARLEMEIMG